MVVVVGEGEEVGELCSDLGEVKDYVCVVLDFCLFFGMVLVVVFVLDWVGVVWEEFDFGIVCFGWKYMGWGVVVEG